jgi:hypothetical protein
MSRRKSGQMEFMKARVNVRYSNWQRSNEYSLFSVCKDKSTEEQQYAIRKTLHFQQLFIEVMNKKQESDVESGYECMAAKPRT